MHPKFQRADELSRLAIGAVIEVHKLKGPGLIIHFHPVRLVDGVHRMIAKNADEENP